MSRLLHASCLVSLLAAVPTLSGCGAKPASSDPCIITYGLSVAPTSGTADHMAPPPGNQVQFVGQVHPVTPSGCATPAYAGLSFATWTNPDPTDIQISSATDQTNGTAICKSATVGAVTLTGAFALPGGTASAPNTTSVSVTLTCK